MPETASPCARRQAPRRPHARRSRSRRRRRIRRMPASTRSPSPSSGRPRASSPANELDLANGRENGLSDGLLDRLRLDPPRSRVSPPPSARSSPCPTRSARPCAARPCRTACASPRCACRFGVVGAIYEARPNVTIDIAALALKSGNAVVLRGGSAAENTNRVLVELLQEALDAASACRPMPCRPIDEFGRDGATPAHAGPRPRRRAHPARKRPAHRRRRRASRRCP